MRRPTEMIEPIVVAGGGLAGAAASYLLARAGRRVIVLEREVGPVDKICGEFIGRGAQLYLARLGIDVAALGAHAITQLRLVRGASLVEATLPFPGFGLSRSSSTRRS
jgi:menaquinone-9 beta-reductase